MLTRERLLQEMALSEQQEEQTYTALTRELLSTLQAPLRELYDEMYAATQGLCNITPEVLMTRPRIIKILRYAVAPSISQMRLGQIAGIGTTDSFEEKGRVPTGEQAERFARWFQQQLDRERFPWLDEAAAPLSESERSIAERYAKVCTVALVSDQNTATAYRRRRKLRQEEEIASALRLAGLREQGYLGIQPTSQQTAFLAAVQPRQWAHRLGGITTLNDVWPGHFVREQKILSGRRQKADLTARPIAMAQLYCIEAKAVGIRLDSTKRLKELNDKQADWARSGLPITPVGVCAGFFNLIELVATIRGRGIPIFWEHNLRELAAFVMDGTYYGALWNPAVLFPEVPPDEVQRRLEEIEAARALSADEQGAGSGAGDLAAR